MIEMAPGLYKTDHESPLPSAPGFKTSAYFLLRPQGNLLIYSSGKVRRCFDFMRSKGGVSRQYLSHRDEASESCDWVSDEFQAALFCPEAEKKEISSKCGVAGTYAGDGALGEDLEVMATPGHTPGSSCFYWRAPGRNILFVGDNLIPGADGVWYTFLVDKSDENRVRTAQSLVKIRNLDVDMVVPAGSEGDFLYREVTAPQWRAIVDGGINRLGR